MLQPGYSPDIAQLTKPHKIAHFTKAANTGDIKRAHVTESTKNRRDLKYLILALLTKSRETGEIPITKKNKKQVGDYDR